MADDVASWTDAARLAKLRVQMVSLALDAQGDTWHIMSVLELPPSASCSRYVSLLLR